MKPIVATYYLRDRETGHIQSIVKATDVTRCLMGECYSAISWELPDWNVAKWEFFADVYCKFDGCTHWWFKGENHNPDDEDESDISAYYHICGPECFTEYIRNMCFIWKVAEMVLIESHPDGNYPDIVRENYEVNGFTGKLVDMMLEDFVITKD